VRRINSGPRKICPVKGGTTKGLVELVGVKTDSSAVLGSDLEHYCETEAGTVDIALHWGSHAPNDSDIAAHPRWCLGEIPDIFQLVNNV
jgi:hypothetical protein